MIERSQSPCSWRASHNRLVRPTDWPAFSFLGHSMDFHRGQLDGLRFREYRAYERTAVLRDGRIVYVAGPVSRAYVDGLRQAGCRIR